MKYLDAKPRAFGWPFSFVLLAAVLLAATFALPRHAAAQQSAPAAASGSGSGAASDHGDASTATSDEQKQLNIFRHAPLVAKIGQKMGMDVETTAKVFEAINFVIIILAIVIPIARTVPKMLRKRSVTLSHDIQTAREATTEANTRLSAVEAKLAGLDAEIQKYRAQIEQESQEDEKRIKASIGEESARIVAAAEQEIAMAAAQAQRGLRNFAADLAISQAEKQLVLTAETDRALIDEFIAGVASNGGLAGNGAQRGGSN